MKLFLFIVLSIVSCTSSFNVLLVSTPPAGHSFHMLALGEELVRRGHNVTFCSVDGYMNMKDKSEERGMLYLSAGELEVDSQARSEFIQQATKMSIKSIKAIKSIPMLIANLTKHSGLNPIIEHLLKIDIKQWDIVIVEEMLRYSVPCIAKLNNVKVISTGSQEFNSRQLWTVPLLGSGASDNMKFHERMFSTVLRGGLKLLNERILLGSELTNPICEEVFSWSPSEGWEFPLIVTTVMGLYYPRIIPPMTQYVGPILSQDAINKPLPNDIMEWLNSKNERSVIYISMGSAFGASLSMAKAFIEGTRYTEYSVMWSLNKFSFHVIDNVDLDEKKYYVSSWIPQVNVLQHKSISMGIVHGGANGIHEALYFGVPLIVLPQFGDQFDRATEVENAGVGIKLLSHQVTPTAIKEGIDKLNSGEYHVNAQRMKAIMRNAGGVNKAADLVEFYSLVGYDHLISAPIKYHWNWIQYYNIDVHIIVRCVILTMICLVVTICRRCCFRKKLKQH